ncbi:MAG: hypothetical protein GWN31_06310, partial [Candidatus Thorarchaeota archaeon]|nr:hypothetical protein [Candidatus Thorarchaeota archaeon]NIW51638.1 hypothetical protein [Candidatus Korarchaeota archaeon]
SKTINCPKGTTTEALSDLLLEYIHDLKGVTVYVDGAKEGAPLNRVELKDVRKMMKKIGEEIKVEGMKEEDLQSCRGGTCDI